MVVHRGAVPGVERRCGGRWWCPTGAAVGGGGGTPDRGRVLIGCVASHGSEDSGSAKPVDGWIHELVADQIW